MNLELVVVEPDDHSKYAPPFDEHDGFTDRSWNPRNTLCGCGSRPTLMLRFGVLGTVRTLDPISPLCACVILM